MESAPKKYSLSASLICADILNLKEEIKRLENGGIDYIHFDAMDGRFVPRYGLYPEMLKAIKSITKIPIDVHMMVEDAEPYIKTFAEAGADIFMPHVEAQRHLHRTVKMIKDSGMKAGVALNPATPLNVLDYILDDINFVMLMAINPGIVGHKLIPGILPKIAELKQKIGDRDIKIEIDGGVTFESAPQMIRLGADMLVCGSATIFKPSMAIDMKIKELRETIDKNLYV